MTAQGPTHPRFLAVLEREHVAATFFQIGDLIARFGQGGGIERRILADGDSGPGLYGNGKTPP